MPAFGSFPPVPAVLDSRFVSVDVLFLSIQLDPTIYESLQKEKVQVGDVIYIEANSGAVKVPGDSSNGVNLLIPPLLSLPPPHFSPQRQGRSDAFATEYDLEADEYIPLPKGEVGVFLKKLLPLSFSKA